MSRRRTDTKTTRIITTATTTTPLFLLLCLISWKLSISKIIEANNKPASLLNDGYHYEINSIKHSNHAFRTQYAAQMLSYMNLSVEPCEDFYEYACGNWKNTIQVRQTEKRRYNLGDIEYKLLDIAEEILLRPNIDDVAPEYSKEFQLAQKLYSNCLNADLTKMSQSPEYLTVIQQIGGFPAIDPQWNRMQFHWLNMSAHMSNYQLENLVVEGTDAMYPFTPFFVLPNLGFDIELHPDNIVDKNSNAYKMNEKTMRKILSIYNVPEDQIVKVINEIFDYLESLLVVMKEFDENRFKCEAFGTEDPRYDDTIDKLWLNYYDIAWMGKFQTVEPHNKPCSYFYYKLHDISEERPEAVANYLSLKFLYSVDAHLKGKEFQKEFCTTKIKNVMTFLIDHIYMKLYVDQETLEGVRNKIQVMRQSLRTIIEQADWLDEATKEAALLKESTLKVIVGRYEDSAMTSRLIGELQRLEYVESNYDANNLNTKKFNQLMARYIGLYHDDLSNAAKPVTLLVGMQANAFNFILENAVYIMAGVLQPPQFHKSWPNALQYGTLGYLLGHELTHGFDTEGSMYDHVGEKNPWWSEESKNHFDERAQCFIDSFDKFYVPEINRHINGNLTRDENIADAGGLRVGFTAYHRFVERVEKSSDFDISDNVEQLPGIDVTPDQLFFLGAAQIWCSMFTEANYWEELADVHTIDKYRVLGMVANNADFARAYNCPAGSKLNPPEKCKVW